jgi:hypothetical protein
LSLAAQQESCCIPKGTRTAWLGGSGNWSDASKWSNGVPNNVPCPHPNPTVFIALIGHGESMVTLDISPHINSLTVGANDRLEIAPGNDLELYALFSGVPAAVSNAGEIVIAGAMSADGSDVTSVSNTGHILVTDGGTLRASTDERFTPYSVSNAGSILVKSTGNVAQLLVYRTLSGTGVVKLSGTSSNLAAVCGASFTNQSTIEGGGGRVGTISQDCGPGTLTNEGLVNANVSGAELVVNPSDTINTGTMEASNGGVLVLSNGTPMTIDNTGGTIKALDGSAVRLDGATISEGTLATSGSGAIESSAVGGTLTGVNGSGGLTNAGNIKILDGTTITLKSTINNTGTISLNSTGHSTELAASGKVTLTGKGTVTLSNNANNVIACSTAGPSAVLVNRSTIQGAGTVGSNGACSIGVNNVGTIRANQTIPLLVTPARSGFNNLGRLSVNSGSILRISNSGGPFLNYDGTTGTLAGGTYEVAGIFEFDDANILRNAATIVLTGSSSRIVDQTGADGLRSFAFNTSKGSFTLAKNRTFNTPGSFSNAGTMVVGRGSIFTVSGAADYAQTEGTTTVDGTLTTTGTASFPSGSLMLAAPGSIKVQGGSVFGTGNLAANVQSSGAVTPGDSAAKTGILTVTGSYTQNSTGTLNIGIGGKTVASQFDQLRVADAARLKGTLNVSLLNGFVPAVGDTFIILLAGSRTGSFSTVNGASIDSSEHFVVRHSLNDVTLQVVTGP